MCTFSVLIISLKFSSTSVRIQVFGHKGGCDLLLRASKRVCTFDPVLAHPGSMGSLTLQGLPHRNRDLGAGQDRRN